jgi:hypothetical protein
MTPGGLEKAVQSERTEYSVHDPEAQRIADFIDFLPTIEHISTIEPDIDFSDDDPIRFAEKRFMAFQHNGRPSLYLNAREVQAQPSHIGFQPLVSRGGKRSAHGVFFGVLQLDDAALPIAVKPHTANAFTTGLDDYFKTVAMAQVGFESLTPAGLFLGSDKDQTAYSMTLLEEGLTTIDSIDWADFYPHIEENTGMKELWRAVSDQAAILHAAGNRSHGDMAARNIATNSEGMTFLIDWEHARISKDQARDPEVRYSHSYSDLSVLLESMCLPPHANIGGKSGIGVFYNQNGDWWQGFCDVFFDEYVYMRRELAQVGTHNAQLRQDVEEELEQLTISLKEDVQMMQDICVQIPRLTKVFTLTTA